MRDQARLRRVVLVSPCQGAYGGVEAYVIALVRFFAARGGLEVRLVFKKVKGFHLEEDLAGILGQLQNIRVDFVGRSSLALVRAIAWADIVHGQNASPDVMLLAKLLRKSTVLTIHYNFLMPFSLHKTAWSLAAAAADIRLYVSNFVFGTWEPKKRRPTSLMVHSVCALPGGWVPPTRRQGFSFVARWVENKGINVLIAAYQQARIDKQAWPLWLMGTGPLAEKIRAQLEGPGGAGIHQLGFVSEERKHAVLGRSKWVVVPPQTNEDLGLVPFEARSAGVPCVVTRDGGLPESAGWGAVVCEPGSVESLTAALESVAAMPEDEYEALAVRTRVELTKQLTPMEFYPALYAFLGDRSGGAFRFDGAGAAPW